MLFRISAEALKGDRERCLATGMDDYVSKPISPPALYRVVERFPALCLSTAERPHDTPSVGTRLPTQPHVTEVRPTNPPVSAVPALNWDIAKERLACGTEVLREFVELTKQEAAAQLAEIHRSIDARDFKQLRLTAHTLKSSVTYFGAETLAEAALALEQRGRTESLEGIAPLMVLLERELARFVAALNAGPPD